MNGKPKISFTFPYRWINDPEDRKFLGQNLLNLMKKGGLKDVYQTSNTDAYFSSQANFFITAYIVVLKTHAYQPVKIKLTQSQLETLLKPAFPAAKLVSFQTFFVQSKSSTVLPVMEMEIYHP